MEMRKELGEDVREGQRHQARLHELLRQGRRQRAAAHPIVNASVDGNDVIYHGYADISDRRVHRQGPGHAGAAQRRAHGLRRHRKRHRRVRQEGARRRLGLEDLQGGTFTITNGGTFGSLMSTPIVNPPQSAILGMHAIKERAIVENGQVVAAPMMYIALSYDHRIIDGKDAVLFLVDIKNQLENPHRMLLGHVIARSPAMRGFLFER
jgi:2-oxoglutarate dehydrogenase E2 component (dihydrolipoamide succinyltransferase)